MAEQTKIVIADDHPIFRAGLRQVIESDHSFKVVGEASDGETALRMTQQLVPGVVILDVNMPGLGGFAVIAEMKRRGLAGEIVMLTMHSEEAMFSKVLSLGVPIRRGQAYTSAAVTNYLFKRAATGRPVTGIGSLTPTERMVLRLIADYKTSREIGTALGISRRTVENHRNNISAKLEIHGSHASH